MHYIYIKSLLVSLVICLMISCGMDEDNFKQREPEATIDSAKMEGNREEIKDYKALPDSYWKENLAPEQYGILRKKKTERAFTGKYWDNKEAGIYICAGCGNELFDSTNKFESGTGWPSFDRVISDDKVTLREDRSLWSVRTEVVCASCNGHLGHVFDDGPSDTTGKRYCINSAALEFKPKNK